MAEKNYDFRKRLAILHPPRLASDAEPVQADETLIDTAWKIVPLSDAPVIKQVALDMQDYFRNSMALELPIVPEGTEKIITIGIAPEPDPLTARITASENVVAITGATAREAAQGCYRLEDELNLRGLPAVKQGSRTFTRLFSPRMTHSGWEFEHFPDEHLAQIAHAGMDAILIFLREPPDMTRNGRIDVNAEVARAAKYGLDVYIYPHFHTQAAECHPLDPGAEEFYDDLYGSIIRNAPGIKGLVFVCESIAFPSRDPDTAGYWWNRVPGAKKTNGFYPSTDWPDWIRLVRDVTRRYKPDLDLLFWTYNWFWAEEKERLALIEKLPTDITLHVTYEMGDNAIEKCGIPTWVTDYSITTDGPGTVFASEAALAAKRGIRLTSMTNTGGMTWDCGVVPYIPVPFRWQKRCSSIRESRKKWGLAGLMDSHHYGFTPGVISELVKFAFTAENDAEKDFAVQAHAIAARDFGKANADSVVAVWRDWSEAFYWHSATTYDQYGPLRVGPSYPFTLPGVTMPDPLHPQYEYNNGIKHGTGWKYMFPTYSCPVDRLEGSIAMVEKELPLLEAGNRKMQELLPHVPTEKQDFAKREAGIGSFLYHTVRTQYNVMCYFRAGLKATAEGVGPEEKAAAIAEMHRILDNEEQNVRETIPLVEYDSRLGWEPTMLYTTDADCLKWKLDQLNDARKDLKSLSK